MGTTDDLRVYGGADAYLAACPSRQILDVLANKWTMLVLGALTGGPVRFGALRRRLDGVTPKMLSQTLRTLERDGLLTRTVHPTTPPAVEYALTPLGAGVTDLLTAIRTWSELNLTAVLTAREAYDTRPPSPLAT